MGEFPEISDERRQQIINSALAEFSARGYEKASTNLICKEAGVSKGLLFHYFKSKKGLYLDVLDRCIARYSRIMEEAVADLSEDIVERLFQIMEMKIKLFAEDPQTHAIVIDAFFDIPKDLEEDVKSRYSTLYSKYLPKLYDGLDRGVFRQEIDHQKALELISFVSDGLANKYTKLYKETKDKSVLNLENFNIELQAYMEMLKNGIYSNSCLESREKVRRQPSCSKGG